MWPMRSRLANLLLGCLFPACLLGVIASERRPVAGDCVLSLGFERGQQRFYAEPNVVDVDNADAIFQSRCSFTLIAHVTILNSTGGHVTMQAVDLVADPASNRWRASGTRPYN